MTGTMSGPESPGRCAHTFDPAAWARSHDRECHVDPEADADILEERDGRPVWRCPHVAVGEHEGTAKCVFHLPAAERPPDVDQTDEFVAVVSGERDSVDGDGVRPARFIDATLDRLYLEGGRVGGGEPIDVRHSTIGWTASSSVEVDAPLDASGSTVDGVCRATFLEDVRFLGARFVGESGFGDPDYDYGGALEDATFDRGATFEGVADFSGATFEGRADLAAVRFRDAAAFQGTTFEADGKFSGATFAGRADFSGATLGAWTPFLGTAFEGAASFAGATLGGVNFSAAAFDERADFSEATFDGGGYFIDATFDGRVDFSGASFASDAKADFSGATFDPRSEFDSMTFRADFAGAVFDGDASFSDATFEGVADFTDVSFASVYFVGTSFNDEVDFRTGRSEDAAADSPFRGPADLSELDAREGVDFRIVETAPDGSRVPVFGDEATLADASLPESRLGGTWLGRDVDLSGAGLEGAALVEADVSGVDLSEAVLEGADLRNADLTGARLEDAILTRTRLYGTDFTDARLHGTLFGDARISDATTFLAAGVLWSPLRRLAGFVNALPGVDMPVGHTVVYDPRTPPVAEPADGPGDDGGAATADDISDYTRAAAVYQALESLARTNAAASLASTCFAWRKDMGRKRLVSDRGEGNRRRVVPWLFSWVSNLVTRYGESPYRVLATAAFVVLSWGGLYHRFGLVGRTPPEGPPVSLFEALYFSTMTFTTLGYGDFRPVGRAGQVLAISETSAGVVLLALLVFVFGRRATR